MAKRYFLREYAIMKERMASAAKTIAAASIAMAIMKRFAIDILLTRNVAIAIMCFENIVAIQ
jgi:hypothetical protein